MDLELLQLILVIGFLILSLGIHEAAHAWVAYKCGDSTAKDMGRMTLNPVVHIDLFMTIILPLLLYLTTPFLFGGAKPVPVDGRRLKHPLRDMMLVAVAGPISNFLLAIVFALAWKALIYFGHMSPKELAPTVMFYAIHFNIILAIFNMIPVPPLDGSRVMAYLLPPGVRETYVELERFGMLLVVALLFTGVLRSVIFAVYNPLFDLITGPLTGGVW